MEENPLQIVQESISRVINVYGIDLGIFEIHTTNRDQWYLLSFQNMNLAFMASTNLLFLLKEYTMDKDLESTILSENKRYIIMDMFPQKRTEKNKRKNDQEIIDKIFECINKISLKNRLGIKNNITIAINDTYLGFYHFTIKCYENGTNFIRSNVYDDLDKKIIFSSEEKFGLVENDEVALRNDIDDMIKKNSNFSIHRRISGVDLRFFISRNIPLIFNADQFFPLGSNINGQKWFTEMLFFCDLSFMKDPKLMKVCHKFVFTNQKLSAYSRIETNGPTLYYVLSKNLEKKGYQYSSKTATGIQYKSACYFHMSSLVCENTIERVVNFHTHGNEDHDHQNKIPGSGEGLVICCPDSKKLIEYRSAELNIRKEITSTSNSLLNLRESISNHYSGKIFTPKYDLEYDIEKFFSEYVNIHRPELYNLLEIDNLLYPTSIWKRIPTEREIYNLTTCLMLYVYNTSFWDDIISIHLNFEKRKKELSDTTLSSIINMIEHASGQGEIHEKKEMRSMFIFDVTSKTQNEESKRIICKVLSNLTSQEIFDDIHTGFLKIRQIIGIEAKKMSSDIKIIISLNALFTLIEEDQVIIENLLSIFNITELKSFTHLCELFKIMIPSEKQKVCITNSPFVFSFGTTKFIQMKNKKKK